MKNTSMRVAAELCPIPNASRTPLRREAASRYLLDRWGIERKTGTLAKLAVTGGGPKFRHAGRVPLYDPLDLDEWAMSLMSPLKSSTSDARGAA
jgi:hypothetical protein